MTRSELKRYDGRDGTKAYIAFKGKVYDVTQSPLWKEGEHEGMHYAGVDLTEMMANAPHGDEVFKGFLVVGTLEEELSPKGSTSKEIDTFKQRFKVGYKKYHLHPMLVHFPIALHLFSAGMDLLFFADPTASYAIGVFYTFFVATIMGLVAMIPGVLSWWINYDLSKSRPFVVKLVLATLTLLLGVVAISIYLEDPGIVYESSWEGIVYHAIVLFTGFSVIVLGYYGGKITWGSTSKDDVAEAPEPERIVAAPEGSLPQMQRYGLPRSSETMMPPVSLMRESPQMADRKVGTSVSILIGGAAGSGLETLEKILNEAFRRSGYYLFSSKEYMSRVRGGSNTILIRVGDTPLEAPCWEIDLFAVIDAPALEHARARCTDATIILADETVATEESAITAIAMKETAKRLGNARYANTYMAGVIFGLLGLEQESLSESVSEHFDGDSVNAAAVLEGVQAGKELKIPGSPVLPKVQKASVDALHMMDGTTASGFGLLSGGCDFIASYPMSPSTGVLNFMASMSKAMPIVIEQSEDEIAALHMVMGAWYAGARAMTTTSGGGFALMGEALSLSGMTETPAVIYLAQRPGPATGLPTRSEQGDLNMALYSGHGPFPRVLLAPGSLRECIDLGYLAFELADRYQLPVIVLSDQYLADSVAMIEDVDFSSYEQRRYIVSTDAAYQRYVDSPSGISPRGVPGLGEGLVCADGHEHDERGQITEDHQKRVQMANKRARKIEALIAETLAPECVGEGDIAVIGWGSTRGVIAEALQRLGDLGLMQVHFAWVHPLDPDHLGCLKHCTHIIVVENNADGAFADRLLHYGVTVDRRILQYNGLAFFADQLADKIGDAIKDLR